MKNFRQIFIVAFLLATISGDVFAQHAIGWNVELKKIAAKSPNTSWVYFKKELKIAPEDLFTQHANAFGLNAGDEMRLVKTSENPMTGYKYQKFEQYHNGVKVNGANIRVISENGIAIKATGHVVKNLPAPSINLKSKEQAIQTATDLMPAKDFLWLDQKRVERYQKKKNDPTASLTPRAELMYCSSSQDTLTTSFILCWKVEVGMQRSDSKVIYLNAENGELIRMYSLDHTCNGTPVETPMNGDQTIYTSKQGRCDNDDYYELWDNCEINIDIENDNYGGGDNNPVCSADNDWLTTLETTGNGVQTLWGMRTTYDWFLNRYGWDSYDGSGSDLDCFINYEFGDNPFDNGNNAAYTYFENFEFGYGDESSDPTDSYTALDIVAHEFTHGVNDYTADEDVGGESAALNESFSDIFGEAIEQMTVDLNSEDKWLVAQAKSNSWIRSMRSPHDGNDPDTYINDFYWDSGSDPEEHNNATVQDFFFYLLCEGGSGVNENGDHYSVSGIGLYKAIDIAWNVLRYEYISDADGYFTSRDAWLEAAKDMYGNCSSEENAVGEAWYAVGVGQLFFPDFAEISYDVDATFFDETVQAPAEVYTSGSVDVTSNDPWEVKFLAGQEVTLNPGFYAVSGTEFTAAIDPCSFTMHDDPQRVAFGDESSENNSESSLDKKSVTVFPNPFTEQFTLSITASSEVDHREAKVYDMTGREVFSQPLSNASGKIEVIINSHDWLPGVYLLKVFDGTHVEDVQRLVKQ